MMDAVMTTAVMVGASAMILGGVVALLGGIAGIVGNESLANRLTLAGCIPVGVGFMVVLVGMFGWWVGAA
jgi:uncharacterized membrane protein